MRVMPAFTPISRALCFLLGLLLAPSAASIGFPRVSTQDIASFISLPLTSVESAPPIVMLAITRDHQLFYKAYNDYTDLTGDGRAETTYSHQVDYYGYFDSFKCYVYQNDRFEPASITPDKYCSGEWSGNFLNWVSMTRMDAVRRLLYGGSRSTDTADLTVLERVHLPSDAHSFAKYYNGDDIGNLTPFNDVATTPVTTTSSSSHNIAFSSGDKTFSNLDHGQVSGTMAIGDQIRLEPSVNANGRFMIGHVTTVSNGTRVTVLVPNGGFSGTGSHNGTWRVTNLSSVGISFCNTTWSSSNSNVGGNDNRYSHTTNRPPLLRVARGNFELWGANERWQCHWREERDGNFNNGNRAFFSGLNANERNPRKTQASNQPQHALGSGSNAGNANTATGEFIVRVTACVRGLEGRERCKQYPTVGSVRKPIGLLQVYGDDDRIRFGLATSSYQRNVSGGVIRKNVGSLANEINIATNGTFIGNPANGGIIDTINRFRMWGYRHGNEGTYISSDRENCDFQLVGIAATGQTPGFREVAEGSCASWGNPLGELYVETLRYLAGLAPDDRFNYTGTNNNKDGSLGLRYFGNAGAPWTDPLNEDNYCASLNVLAFTASVSSYDSDQMNGLQNLAGSPDINAWTDRVGSGEGIHGGKWFIGNTPDEFNQLCSAKTINRLSQVDGICPEAASLEGSYKIAGAAHFAKNNRIRDDLALPVGDATSLKVNTYGIALATNTPRIDIVAPSDPDKRMVLQPVYRLQRSQSGQTVFGSGAIVDFRIVELDEANGYGKFYVNWEDSTQGGDYDQDVWGTIEYQIKEDTVSITTNVIFDATVNPQGFGYIISGSDKDGPHFHSGILNFNYTDPNPIDVFINGNLANHPSSGPINASGGCRNCARGNSPTTAVYTFGRSLGQALEDPLYYAAKWGGFEDSNGNGIPDLQEEWDRRLDNGLNGQDGVPDNYFLVTNPLALEQSLDAAFRSILARTASGTAAAVVANAREGEGAIYQALFEAARTDANGDEARWIGTLHGLFVDSAGRLREGTPDGAGNVRLLDNNFTANPAVELFFDPSDRTTKLRRFRGDPDTTAPEIAPLSSLRTLWNAREQLSKLSDVTTQRIEYTDAAYQASAANGRFIFTWLDYNLNGEVDSGEVVPFAENSFVAGSGSTGNYGILNARDPSATTDAQRQQNARDLVNYVRGVEIPGLRNRTINYDNDAANTRETQRLSDIVNSTPTVVGTPAEAFDLLYDDQTYAAFRERYRNRRNVVYVGSNGGLLHAFNAGFYNAATQQFSTTRGSETAHPLGAELWAYAPFNLLPHLTWLADPDYNHVWYMDGKPRVFDARIFPPSADHPGGWGTVLVAGMRLGGAPITLPTANAPNGFTAFRSGGSTPGEITTRSAFVVLDITNPEAAPKLLAELTPPELGFTTSFPTVVAVSNVDRTNDSSDDDLWLLLFGNGPVEDNGLPSSAQAGIYAYDLKARSFVNNWSPKKLGANAASSFVGDLTTVDWDLDFKADSVYFGTVGGTTAAPNGRLYKIDLGTAASRPPSAWTGPLVLADPGRPVTATPSVTFSETGERWVFAGTGRFLANDDKTSTARQALFGVIDPAPGETGHNTAAGYASLLDVSGARVFSDATVQGVANVSSQQELVDAAQLARGWRLDLSVPTNAERNISQFSILGDIVFGTAFTPSTDLCGGEGSSRLFGLFFKTGAPLASLPTFGTRPGADDAAPQELVRAVSLGAGQAASPSLHIGGARDQRGLTIFTQTSVGAIETREGLVSGEQRSGEVDWREPRQ